MLAFCFAGVIGVLLLAIFAIERLDQSLLFQEFYHDSYLPI